MHTRVGARELRDHVLALMATAERRLAVVWARPRALA
jgi:hypothetical protein